MKSLSDLIDEIKSDAKIEVWRWLREGVQRVKYGPSSVSRSLVPFGETTLQNAVVFIQSDGLRQGHLSVEIKHQAAHV